MLNRIPTKWLAAGVALVVVAALLLSVGGGDKTRTVSAYFSQAVSIYKGSDVELMGVPIGKVTAVVPEGGQVRVEMSYDAKYTLPANVKAVMVTPTLIADRFVQLTPAYRGGAKLAQSAHIPMSRTAVPVEMDRIYSSLDDLTRTLGPDGANKSGALNDVLSAGSKALKGNGRLGNKMLSRLAQAVQTFGNHSGQIFGTVDDLAQITRTLQSNDKTVGAFMTHLARLSGELSGERGDLRQALAAIARAVSLVRGFVYNNKSALETDLKQLTTTTGVLAKRKNDLATVIQLAPLGLGNLTEADDPVTASVGIRLQLGPNVSSLGNLLCGVLSVNGKTNQQLCSLLNALLPKGLDLGSALDSGTSPVSSTPKRVTSLGGLLGGAKP